MVSRLRRALSWTVVLVSVGAATGAQPAAAADFNLVRNPGFETEGSSPAPPPGRGRPSGPEQPPIANWKAAGIGVQWTDQASLAESGRRYVGLYGVYDPEAEQPNGSPGMLSQEVPVRPGIEYRLTFKSLPSPSLPRCNIGSEPTVQLDIAGVSRKVFHRGLPPGSTAWQTSAIDFRPTESTVTLSFRAFQRTCGPLLIDSVSIVPVSTLMDYKAYVPDYSRQSANVYPVDVRSATVGSPVFLGWNYTCGPGCHSQEAPVPSDIVAAPDGQSVYVWTDGYKGFGVYSINARTNAPGPFQLIEGLGATTGRVAITPDGNKIFVLSENNNTAGTIWSLDLRTGERREIYFDRSYSLTTALAMSADGKTVFVSTRPVDPRYTTPPFWKVVPVDTNTGAAGTPIPMPAWTTDLALAPDGKTLYAAVPEKGIVPIDVATRKSGPTIPAGTFPRHIAIAPDGRTAYASDDRINGVTPVDLLTRTPGTAIPIPTPNKLAVAPNGRTVAVSAARAVYLIDTDTNTARRAQQSGTIGHALGVAFVPVPGSAPPVRSTQTVSQPHGRASGCGLTLTAPGRRPTQVRSIRATKCAAARRAIATAFRQRAHSARARPSQGFACDFGSSARFVRCVRGRQVVTGSKRRGDAPPSSY